jgi:hypothetical protein
MSTSGDVQATPWSPQQRIGAVLAWLWVLVPFGYGLYQLLLKIPALFGT